MFGFESQRPHYIPAYDDNIIMEKMYKLVHKKITRMFQLLVIGWFATALE